MKVSGKEVLLVLEIMRGSLPCRSLANPRGWVLSLVESESAA